MSRHKPDPRNNKRPLLLPSQQTRGGNAHSTPDTARPAPRRHTQPHSDSYEIHASGDTAYAKDASRQSAHNGDHKPNRSPNRSPDRSTTTRHGLSQASAEPPASWLPLGPGVRLIAYHPCGLYVLDKPEGVLSHPNKKSEADRSLLTAPYSLEGEFFYSLSKRPIISAAKNTAQSSASDDANRMSTTSVEEDGRDNAEVEDSDPAATGEREPEAQPAVAVTPTTSADSAVFPTDDIAPFSTDGTAAFSTEAAATESAGGYAVPQKLHLLHRLDSATSGLLLLADNEALANSVRTAFAQGGVRKTYLALCVATAAIGAGQKGRWNDRLQREHHGAGGNVVHVRTSNSGVSAVTDFQCRATAPRNHALALMQLHPLSGRTHQLRVHCAQHGLPIVGDAKYGDFRLNRALAKESGLKRLFLHATSLELEFTYAGKSLRMQFTSPQPPAFDALLRDAPDIRASTPAAPRKGRGTAAQSGGRAPQGGKGGGKSGSKTRQGRNAPPAGGKSRQHKRR